MKMKIQSESIPFDEFYAQHPVDTILIPKSYGLDGAIVQQLLLSFALNLIKDLIVYVVKKISEKGKKEEPKGDVTFVFENGIRVCIPLSEFDNADNVFKKVTAVAERIELEYGKCDSL